MLRRNPGIAPPISGGSVFRELRERVSAEECRLLPVLSLRANFGVTPADPAPHSWALDSEAARSQPLARVLHDAALPIYLTLTECFHSRRRVANVDSLSVREREMAAGQGRNPLRRDLVTDGSRFAGYNATAGGPSQTRSEPSCAHRTRSNRLLRPRRRGPI